MIPFVIEKTAQGERSYDIFSRMLKDRVVFLNGGVHTEMSHAIIAQMLFLESEDPDREIFFYINSPGGEVSAGLAIYDCMQFIKCDVRTIVMGQACSMGSFLAQAGTAGKRMVLPESRTMIHRVSSGTPGTSGSVHIQDLQFEDAKRSFDEAKRVNQRLTELYVKHNSKGKTFDDMSEAMKFDTYLSAQEAVNFGLADEVVVNR
jgi:ATP-dependent Clp protease, protease subunit